MFTCAYKTPVGTHDGSVNAIVGAPRAEGFACASSADGVMIVRRGRGTRGVGRLSVHAVGTGVSWRRRRAVAVARLRGARRRRD